MSSKIVHSGLADLAFESETIFRSGEGGLVYSETGEEFIDFVLGYGAVILGHGGTRTESPPLNSECNMLPGYTTWHKKYLELLTKDIAIPLSAAFFKSGSEGNLAALRLASFITQRKKFIRCGFLGWHDQFIGNSVYWHEALDSPFRNARRFQNFAPTGAGYEDILDWVSLDGDELQRLIDSNSGQISCLILDAYQERFQAGSIEMAIEICKSNDILVIIDETKTAGRASRLGSSFTSNNDVDLVVGGKALANGLPISVLLGRPEIMKYSKDVRITGTFSQELSGVFGGIETFNKMEEAEGYIKIRELTRKFSYIFNDTVKKLSLDNFLTLETPFHGAFFEVVFAKPILGDWDIRVRLCRCFSDCGIVLLQGHPSYFCLGHEYIDEDSLEERTYKALLLWKKAISL